MSETLRSLIQLSSNIEEMLLLSNGEITPEIENMLIVSEAQLPEKIDNYSLLMERMDTICDFYAAKAEFFAKLAAASAAISDKCEDNLKIVMMENSLEELFGNDVRFKLQKSNPSVIIEDEKKLDESYKSLVTTVKIDKKKISEDLKLGVPINGAHLEQGYHVKKYANTPGRRK